MYNHFTCVVICVKQRKIRQFCRCITLVDSAHSGKLLTIHAIEGTVLTVAGASNRSRTCTVLPLDPKSSAYANFAILAYVGARDRNRTGTGS